MIAVLDKIELGYDDLGTGGSGAAHANGDSTLLFVHGFPHNRSLWTPQLSAIGVRARCVAVDLRGFGESSVAPPYSMDQYADDIAGLLDFLRIERAIVCGLSMGGYIAFALWRRHRSRVRALILADTRAGGDSEEARAKRVSMAELALKSGSSAVADAMIAGMVGKHTREHCPGIADAVHRMLAAAPVPGVVGALQAMRERMDSTATLGTITVPTLIVVGEDDVLTPVAEAEAMQGAISGSRLEVLERAGHVSNVERPAAFNHVVSEFLATLRYA
ncbi:MAG: alpha/beta fold hydrolase [Gemmatimonadaceae bacterium]